MTIPIKMRSKCRIWVSSFLPATCHLSPNTCLSPPVSCLSTPGKLIILLIRVYQAAVSPLLGPCCRFYPSCSAYCLEAVRVHGWPRGLLLGLRRLLKCHPFHPGGVDPVPRGNRAEATQPEPSFVTHLNV